MIFDKALIALSDVKNWGKIVVRIVVLFGASLAASPAVAQDAPAPAPEKKICKMITPTGSIMDKRFCLTKSEWQQFDNINEVSAQTALNARKLSKPKGE